MTHTTPTERPCVLNNLSTQRVRSTAPDTANMVAVLLSYRGAEIELIAGQT